MIKTNFIIFVYLLCFALFPLRAEIIKKIEIVGNSRISDETIKVYGKVKEPNSNYSKDELDNILKDLYSTNFFENVSLEVRDKTLIIRLDEYPVVSQLLIIGEKSNKFKDGIKKIISMKEKSSFIENNLNNDINEIENFYSALGYNFSEVTAEIRKVDEKNFDLIYRIKRGELTKISKISFTIIGANPMEGSSSRTTLGREIKALPIASICCSPPDVNPAKL